jgi:phosphoribosylaminoimidazolecarboxamide formyltransferase/IMP cyclohydrolase
MSKQKTALLSAYDKTGLEEFAGELVALGWDLLASAGTTKYLAKKKIKARDVAEIVGPPILGHRVVTLSREIHAALLAKDTAEDCAELKRLGIPFIGLVYVNFYPLQEEIAKADCTLESVVEKTDIGGPTLLRSGAKGRRLAVSAPNQFEGVISFLNGKMGKSRRDKDRFISTLAGLAEWRVSEYCKASSDFHEKIAKKQK